MSLDVYLELPGEPQTYAQQLIFVREDGATIELSREEWDRRFPGREPATIEATPSDTVFERNITHNLGKMADAAGLYDPMWGAEDHGLTHARMLIEPLRTGLERLRADPETFKKLNPSNGWGNYDGLVAFAAAYLEACTQYPDATVRVSR